ncbi:DUF1360 domain-containing protein [Dactylosporangium vinaceum]|uniref:DUF1360 domain-containing protein n=1 Tax=Dactylosporangium vinaceum TaxID=53362 RepID=A0ABV5MRK6_9ACTN|nr:DUF1360 domain-containing protein [Dactylosporangium vinaceum]UAC00430.1 DUF1360 domain-containing protein [Dactylosporangium vinaceum]
MVDIDSRTARTYARKASDERPLRGYATVMGVFAAAAGTVAAVARLTGRRLPERPSVGDVALLAVATHKVSRLITKDAITSPLRAPFTEFEGAAGEAELNESPRGHGARHAVGELLTCPFCTGVWVAGGLGAGLVLAPRLTRFGMGVATAVAASDFLHLAYDVAKRAANGPS